MSKMGGWLKWKRTLNSRERCGPPSKAVSGLRRQQSISIIQTGLIFLLKGLVRKGRASGSGFPGIKLLMR
jgi:hypothetical protein